MDHTRDHDETGDSARLSNLDLPEEAPVDGGTSVSMPGLSRPRHVTPEQFRRFEGYVAEMFQAFGMDPGTPGTEATPRRFVKALYDATEGYEGDPKLLTLFPSECRRETACEITQVVEGPIPFFALCEHHVFPFYGNGFVGYIPNDQIIGISKLTRLVRVWARRFTVQERMGDEIAATLERMTHPRGVAVYLEAHHLCTQMRGVREMHPKTRTVSWRGQYTADAALRREFLDMVNASAKEG